MFSVTWPNNSLAIKIFGFAQQFNAVIVPDERGDNARTVFAASSIPAPLPPEINADALPLAVSSRFGNLSGNLTTDNLAAAIKLVAPSQEIRVFEPVKMKAFETYEGALTSTRKAFSEASNIHYASAWEIFVPAMRGYVNLQLPLMANTVSMILPTLM